jgi:hypothetical protein
MPLGKVGRMWTSLDVVFHTVMDVNKTNSVVQLVFRPPTYESGSLECGGCTEIGADVGIYDVSIAKT